VARASGFAVGEEVSLITCSAEDLVVLKAFVGRDKDWLDIDGILTHQAGHFDQRLMWRELRPLLEVRPAPETKKRLRARLAR